MSTPANNAIDSGLTTIFELERHKWTEENIKKLFLDVIPIKYNWPEDRWMDANHAMLVKVPILLRDTTVRFEYVYNPFKPNDHFTLAIHVSPHAFFYYYPVNYSTTNIIIGITTQASQIRYMEKDPIKIINEKIYEKIQFYLSFMKSIFTFFECPYGWTDTYDFLKKNQTVDPRGFKYCINYYGTEMAKTIDIDTLEKTNLTQIQKFDWGGLIVQVPKGENPFVKIPNEDRRKIIDIIQKRCMEKITLP